MYVYIYIYITARPPSESRARLQAPDVLNLELLQRIDLAHRTNSGKMVVQ